MLIKIENFLHRVYKFSGILAAIFLILVAVFILIGISSRIFDFYIRGLSEYSGYCMAASTFFALAYTFSEGGHIRITLFLEKMSSRLKKIFEIWCLTISSIFSGFLFFYFSKMLFISYKFQENILFLVEYYLYQIYILNQLLHRSAFEYFFLKLET